GTGWMAQEHARRFSAIAGVDIVGAVDVDAARVGDFADSHKIPKRFTSLEAAIDWGQFDAVANVTPDRMHHPTTMALIAAGKPVLCEKPLGLTAFEADAMMHAARKA
ncbi:Gfo/Idh/MocA family oxidoreductase, partial [bacterium M00.F.Ca.ET.180.01.1.1]